MFASIEPPNERTLIITKILKIFCVLTLIVGVFKFSSQPLDTSSLLYFLAGLLYFLSWRGLSYYYCLSNAVINVSMIFILLQEMAKLLQNGHYQTYFSSAGFYKMGCLIFSIISIYFNFNGYKMFKQLAMQIYEYQQKIGIQQ